MVVVLAVGAVVYAADQASKVWALTHLQPGVRTPWWGEFLQWHLIFNPGAAFSIGTDVTWLFTMIQGGVTVGVIAFSSRLRSWWWVIGAGLVLGGAAGNVTDRLIRPPGIGVGHVVDFLELPHWPIFNVADAAIVTAAVIIAVATLWGIGPTGRIEDPKQEVKGDEAHG
ncbi:Lipoprotein signal peptidase [Austwickia sp. TVS 96-490-7B]|nr:Lipoprotein signal peptidase [Austwickia sp. TVS 96-490-7B]